jgi:hypothetical protein
MARTDYGPEIRSSLGSGQLGRVNTSPPKESPADMKRDAARGIREGSATDQKLDARTGNQQSPPRGGGAVVISGPPSAGASRPPNPGGGGVPPDLHHVAAATSIAHAILNRSGGGGGL